jgi:hypothetical protein
MGYERVNPIQLCRPPETRSQGIEPFTNGASTIGHQAVTIVHPVSRNDTTYLQAKQAAAFIACSKE